MADAHGDTEPPCKELVVEFLDEEKKFLDRVVFLIDERRVECWREGDPNVAMSSRPRDPAFAPRWRIHFLGAEGPGDILETDELNDGPISRDEICRAAQKWLQAWRRRWRS